MISRLRRRHTITCLLVAATSLVFYLTVLRLDPHSSIQTAFEPWPDGPEALDGAVNLARSGSFSIQIAGQRLPTRYPFGYSLLGALGILLGASPETALYRVNRAAALALLAILFVHFARRGLALRGGLATLLLVSSPAFIVLCRGPRSEIPSLAILAAGWVCLIAWDDKGSRLSGPVGAFLVGVSLWFRISNFLLLPFLVAAVVREGPQPQADILRKSCKLFACALLGVLPLLAYHWIEFGHPLRTGYSFWLTSHTSWDAFQLQHVPGQLAYLWRDVWESENTFRTAHIYGHGSYLNPSLTCLLMVGLALARRTRRFWWCVAAGAFYAAAMLSYFYMDFRLYLPVFALAVVESAGALTEFAKRKWERGAIWTVIFSVALATLAALGVPGRTGWSSLIELVDLQSLQKTTQPYALTERAREALPERVLILTDLPPPYVHGLGKEGWVVAPLNSKHEYRYNPGNFVFDEARRDALVREQLNQGVPTAAIAVEGLDILTRDCQLPAPYAWKPLYRDPRGGVLATASP